MIVRDGDWKLYDYDFQTGRSVWVMEDGNRTHWRTDYPVENLVRQNAFTRHATAGNAFGDWTKVASVPLNLAHSKSLIRAHSEGDDRYVKRWLNDGDNRAWRSFEGHL
ncbi:hypothetical protein [Sinorhizobium americanum]|uniref:hypothetical protein n=1 Tax=Sinorhizobium americanum TaxID=194963 RepID=UPI00055C8009|nr:hypothetical protein [Sinorhizobium americanum]OAP49039.1 hypothetical protein ATC00_16710 [Sinorhizobium americanum]